MKKCLLLFFLSLFILFPKTQFAQWTTVLSDGNYIIYGIEFKDENTAFAAGYSNNIDSAVIIRSLDGGNNWEEVYTQSSDLTGPYCFDFINDTLYISGGENGLLFKSTDGGSSWEMFSNIPGTNDINNIHFFNDTIGIATYSRTIDGGYNWENMEIGNTNDYFQINDSSVFTSSSGGLYYTDDFGETWIKVDTCQNVGFSSICMATDLVGYAATLSLYTGKVYKSIDGGWSWFEIKSLPDYEIKQIRFSDENNGYLLMNTGMGNYGGSMRVLKTTDGGNSWDFVLFGTDYSFQMAFANESTILVPTTNGIMYKTTNGGGEPIFPHYPEIDWYSTLRYWHDPFPPLICINSSSQPYLMDSFRDTLFINESTFIASSNPLISSVFILRYNTWGSLDWYTIVEKPDKKILGQSSTIDNDNNYYLIYRESEPDIWDYTTKLIKYSNEGDSLWAITLDSTNSLDNLNINFGPEENIIISGCFTGTFSFENNIINTDNDGIFVLQLNQDGNFVKLDRIIESHGFGNKLLFNVNDEGSLCLSYRGYGSSYINQDTLDHSLYYFLYFDEDLNLLWSNTNFDIIGKTIDNITFNSNSKILLMGHDIFQDIPYQIVYQYNDQGIKTDSAYINVGEEYSYRSSICTTTNNRILTTGKFDNLAILENDTLYGFHRFSNIYIYTLTDDLEFVKSSYVSGVRFSDVVENLHNSYLAGEIDDEIIFNNDTIIFNDEDYFIAKLNSIITPVSEKVLHNKLMVYPNPSTGMFSVVLPGGQTKNAFIEIFNITGQKVYEGLISEHNQTMDLSKLNEGIYFIQLNFEGEIFSQKIILQ